VFSKFHVLERGGAAGRRGAIRLPVVRRILRTVRTKPLEPARMLGSSTGPRAEKSGIGGLSGSFLARAMRPAA